MTFLDSALLEAPTRSPCIASRPRWLAVVPAYNDAATIGLVVRDLADHGIAVIVVDDGSRDGTGDVAARAGAHVVRHHANRGKGAALATGFELALARGARAVVTLDGDGQHRASDAARLLRARDEDGWDVLVGDRLASPGPMPLARRATNVAMSLLLAAVFGTRVRDSQCGLRAMSSRFLASARLRCLRFEIESELLIEATRLRATIASLPIATLYPRGGASRIRPLVDAVRFARLILTRVL